MNTRGIAGAFAVVAFMSMLVPADASTTSYSAPFPCASDESARRTGILISPSSIPHLPGITHCGDTPVLNGTGVWASITTQVPGIATIAVDSSPDSSSCPFVAYSNIVMIDCTDSSMSLELGAGVVVDAGAVVMEGGVAASLVKSFTVSFG